MDIAIQPLVRLFEKTDSKKKVQDIIEGYGYPFERHFYETEDGFINMVIRISGKISII